MSKNEILDAISKLPDTADFKCELKVFAQPSQTYKKYNSLREAIKAILVYDRTISPKAIADLLHANHNTVRTQIHRDILPYISNTENDYN